VPNCSPMASAYETAVQDMGAMPYNTYTAPSSQVTVAVATAGSAILTFLVVQTVALTVSGLLYARPISASSLVLSRAQTVKPSQVPTTMTAPWATPGSIPRGTGAHLVVRPSSGHEGPQHNAPEGSGVQPLPLALPLLAVASIVTIAATCLKRLASKPALLRVPPPLASPNNATISVVNKGVPYMNVGKGEIASIDSSQSATTVEANQIVHFLPPCMDSTNHNTTVRLPILQQAVLLAVVFALLEGIVCVLVGGFVGLCGPSLASLSRNNEEAVLLAVDQALSYASIITIPICALLSGALDVAVQAVGLEINVRLHAVGGLNIGLLATLYVTLLLA